MLTLALLLQTALGPLDVTGVWWTEDKTSQVEITREGDQIEGRVIWYEGVGEDEVPATDTANPDEELRGREIIGLPILTDFEKAERKWRRGEIYDPVEGKTYRSAVRREGDTLKVEGCVAIICLTQDWQAVEKGEVRRASAQRR
jgi:uncharacterized protein (DUF2147 family)